MGNNDKLRGNYDAVIIGFGKGGKTLAGDLASKGLSVAIVEKSVKMYGGTCINVGCIPTKSMVHSAQEAVVKGAGSFEEQARRYAEAVEEKERVTSMLRGKNYKKLADLSNVEVIDGTAAFIGPKQIEVRTEQGILTLKGEKIFINTGSTSVIPPIKGISDSPRVYTSQTLLELKELPKRLVIIGGGYIGLEFASFFTSFGSQVTVLQDGPRFLPREDEDIAEAIKAAFEKRGVKFLLNAKTAEIRDDGEQATVFYYQEDAAGTHSDRTDESPTNDALRELSAEAVLVATGRRPNTDNLGLEKAGIKTTARGAVEVDELRRTSAPDVWAMGDVAGGLQHTYVSLDDYRIVRSQLNPGAKPYTAADRKNVPYSVFIEPSYSRVGLNEREAREQGYEVKVVKMPAAGVPKAQVLRETEGMLKAVLDGKNGRILGAMMFCAESYETINIIKLAMDAGVPASVLGNQIFTHPTMSEALNDLFA